MPTHQGPIRVLRTVYFDEKTGAFCQCQGGFYKTCPLRAANDLPCKESILSITPVDRSGEELVSDGLRALNPQLKSLTDKMRDLSKKGIF